MGIFGHKDESEYLFCFENLENEIQSQQIEFSDQKCEFDLCPFFAVKEYDLCQLHLKEKENIDSGKQPDGEIK